MRREREEGGGVCVAGGGLLLDDLGLRHNREEDVVRLEALLHGEGEDCHLVHGGWVCFVGRAVRCFPGFPLVWGGRS